MAPGWRAVQGNGPDQAGYTAYFTAGVGDDECAKVWRSKGPEAECRKPQTKPTCHIEIGNRKSFLKTNYKGTNPVFRTEPVQARGLQIGFQSFTYLGRHRIVLVRTTADYAALFRESSNSSQSLVNPSTTILNAYGIFTGLSTDTTYLKVTN